MSNTKLKPCPFCGKELDERDAQNSIFGARVISYDRVLTFELGGGSGNSAIPFDACIFRRGDSK